MPTTSIIFNIQQFSLHDGPGIRTTVFFKGCPLHCLWCSNPESQSYEIEHGWDRERCQPSAACPKDCPYSPDFSGVEHESSVTTCPQGAWTEYGSRMALESVLAAVSKDLPFYEESGGGVTLSGGEVLYQWPFAARLLAALKKQGIHTAVETAGVGSRQGVQALAEHCDLWLFDLKHHNSARHQEFTGQPLQPILENLTYLLAKAVPIEIRIPIIPGVNDTRADAAAFADLLQNTMRAAAEEQSAHENGLPILLLPFHQMGQKKYGLLGRPYRFAELAALHPNELEEFAAVLRGYGCDVAF